MQKLVLKTVAVLFVAISSSLNINGQSDNDGSGFGPPQTGAPFLTITPESRGGAMGDVGAATSPDINSQHWNSAKYAFLDQEMGAAISYTPWLRNLVNDINLMYATFFKRIDKMQTFSASFRYFALGDINFTDNSGSIVSSGSPNEFAIDAAYARKLSDNISGSVAFRFIRSDITNGVRDNAISPANAFAADLNFFYTDRVKWGGRNGQFSSGVNFSNIGSKLSYDDGNTNDFLPMNLKLGVAYNTEIDRYNKIGVALDVNRVMVVKQKEGEDVSEKSVPAAFFESFSDFKATDLTFSLGAEYTYAEQFAIRAGYYHEDESMGNGKFATAGAGIKFNMLTIDASYIITMASNNPLANTIRFTLGLNFDELNGGKGRKRR
ncbi:type IX secretion system outer membrane channel protein PorV [Plebeiibacterium marinum]|uniref:Type IX secretion system outer membrane channel protein PorV n=1 Tax=Plebeiibacterium marinum TaxID=2992111 RepID=A0AAE3MB55_9BACT|nr:type IX secretion system outer membrane channel protein PorV [Plebeiobacterium marinum]MCW3804211.1 type IX secretion system outer membrane channel protein PorV [Plebeiobacterium marinum]